MGAVGICPRRAGRNWQRPDLLARLARISPRPRRSRLRNIRRWPAARGHIPAIGRQISDVQGRARRSSLPETAPEDEPCSYVSLGCLARTRLHTEPGNED
jgi:hypothetical protein